MTQCECQGGRRLSCITKVLLESDIKVNWCMNLLNCTMCFKNYYSYFFNFKCINYSIKFNCCCCCWHQQWPAIQKIYNKSKHYGLYILTELKYPKNKTS